MTEKELEEFTKKIDSSIVIKKEGSDHALYYGTKYMGITICGLLDNGGEYTFQTLESEIAYYLKERVLAKLIIAEPEHKKIQPRKKRSNNYSREKF